MEFFAVADVCLTPDALRELLTVDRLPEVCEAVDSVDEAEALGRVVYFCHWGRYHLRREEILGGVRFWVPDCPNALGFTVTTGLPPRPDKVVIHAVVNRAEHDPEFIAATEELVSTLKVGLEGRARPAPEARACDLFAIPDLRPGAKA